MTRRIAALRLNDTAVPNPASTANPMTAGVAYRFTNAPVTTFARTTQTNGITMKPQAAASSCSGSTGVGLAPAASVPLPATIE